MSRPPLTVSALRCVGKLRVRNPRRESRLKVLAENFHMEGWTLTALGFVAGVCTTFSLVPQVMKAWRAADREAISKRTYAVASAAYALWIVHGVMIGSMPIIVFNALALVLGAAILVLKLRDPTIPRNA